MSSNDDERCAVKQYVKGIMQATGSFDEIRKKLMVEFNLALHTVPDEVAERCAFVSNPVYHSKNSTKVSRNNYASMAAARRVDAANFELDAANAALAACKAEGIRLGTESSIARQRNLDTLGTSSDVFEIEVNQSKKEAEEAKEISDNYTQGIEDIYLSNPNSKVKNAQANMECLREALHLLNNTWQKSNAEAKAKLSNVRKKAYAEYTHANTTLWRLVLINDWALGQTGRKKEAEVLQSNVVSANNKYRNAVIRQTAATKEMRLIYLVDKESLGF
jgi:hypothetical protein